MYYDDEGKEKVCALLRPIGKSATSIQEEVASKKKTEHEHEVEVAKLLEKPKKNGS